MPLRHLPADPRRGAPSLTDRGRMSDERHDRFDSPGISQDISRQRRRSFHWLLLALAFASARAGAAGGQTPPAQRVPPHRNRREHHRPARPLRDGPGHLDDPADAARRRIGLRLVEDSRRARAGRAGLRTYGLRPADDGGSTTTWSEY